MGAMVGLAMAKFGVHDKREKSPSVLPHDGSCSTWGNPMRESVSPREATALREQCPMPNAQHPMPNTLSPAPYPSLLTPNSALNTQHPFNTDIAEVLKRVAREDGSSALCGDPGTGKSTITDEYIHQVQSNCPGAEIQVLAIKNDDFCGLRNQGRVSRFIGENAIEIAGVFFNAVDEEYRRRLELLEGDRSSLKPFVIILDDWLAIVATLNKTQITFDFGLILFNILTIGREYNMKFFVNLHSLNLAAIGIKEIDSNSRKILKLLILGNRYSKDGREIDAYGIIEQAIAGGQVVAHAADKEKVRSQYAHFKEESRTNLQPVMFAFVGEYYVGLVPKFDVAVNSPIHPKAELTATDALPEPSRTIWKYAKEQGDWVRVRDIIRKGYAVLKNKNTEDVINCVLSLQEQGYGEVDLTPGKVRFKAD